MGNPPKFVLILCSLLMGSAFFTSAQNYTGYVNPFIGTAATGHTFPGATMPFGMVQLSPETGNFGWNYSSGYRYEDSTITGFAHTHLNGTGGPDLGDILIFPFQGKDPDHFVSGFLRSTEKASPGYYAVILNRDSVKAELTATRHTGLHRYTFNKAGQSHLLIDIQSGLVDAPEELGNHILDGHISIIDDHTITGYTVTTQWVEKKIFFVAKFMQPFTGHHFIDDTAKRRLVLDFDTKLNQHVELVVAISAVSIKGAKLNLTEVNNQSFNEVRAAADKTWDQYLGRLKAEGTKDHLVSFYTSVYHTLIQPNNLADLDGQYRGPDGRVHLFDKSTNLMRGKLMNGDWVRPFANLDSGQLATGGDYTEGNAWQYVWQVQQDVTGLIKLMGGNKDFCAKLDSLFTLDSKVFGKGSTLDVTGLIGQYAHGNEPDHHVAYLYTVAGEPSKTQAMVRRISEEFYQDKPDGLSGNDDCGQMSAWYIFTAIGFYPVNPADGRYILGAPQLKKVSIQVTGARQFKIIAKGLSAANKYVRSISLNGKPYRLNYITHRDIMRGGRLVFEMGDKHQSNL